MFAGVELLLSVEGSLDGTDRVGEHGEDAVTGLLGHVALVLGHRLGQELVMVGDDVLHCPRVFFPEPGAALDVREEKGQDLCSSDQTSRPANLSGGTSGRLQASGIYWAQRMSLTSRIGMGVDLSGSGCIFTSP